MKVDLRSMILQNIRKVEFIVSPKRWQILVRGVTHGSCENGMRRVSAVFPPDPLGAIKLLEPEGCFHFLPP